MTKLKGIMDLTKPLTKEEAYYYYKKKGEMAERLKAAVLKTGNGATKDERQKK